MTYGYYFAIFPFCGGGKKQKKNKKKQKKKDDKKTNAFYDWATTGIPVNIRVFQPLRLETCLDVKMNNFVRDISLICFLPTKS